MYDSRHKLLQITFHSVFKYNYEIQSRPTRHINISIRILIKLTIIYIPYNI